MDSQSSSPSPKSRRPEDVQSFQWTVIVIVAVFTVVVGAAGFVAVWWADPFGQEDSGLSPRFGYDLSQFLDVDPKLVHYKQAAEYPVGSMETPRAVAVGPDDRIHVAGDQAVVTFDADGKKTARIDLEAEPRCLAVTADRLYVGMKDRVEVYELTGKRLAQWAPLGDKSVLTSIAVGDNDVFVADAGRRVVHRYDTSGKLVGDLARTDPRHNIPALVIPSPYFDIALGGDGLLRVVNPGRHLIEYFTLDGEMESPLNWGKSGEKIEGFCGCCNPVHIALLPDGRIVTAEKAIPRVKIYDARGRFECVVVPPRELIYTDASVEEIRPDYKLLAVDVAVDSRQRVLVLDPGRRAVRVFEYMKSTGDAP